MVTFDTMTQFIVYSVACAGVGFGLAFIVIGLFGYRSK